MLIAQRSGVLSWMRSPENATDKELLYESSDTRVVTVDDNGYVYGRKNGNATIKISSADGGAETSVRVYVSDAEDYDEEETRLRNIYITQDDEIVKDKIKYSGLRRYVFMKKI